MFAKGPRFPLEKPSDAPGPGHYRPQEEFRYESYKKGAFLEKADRFGNEKGSDVPGPGTYNTAPKDGNPRMPSKPLPSSHGLTHLQQEIDTLKSQTARLQKEHQQACRKYEDKLAHSESTVKSLVKDNVALQSQVSTQQKEHRAVCQRETALRAALEKAESAQKNQTDHARKFAALQRKLEDLEKLHTDDRKKYQSETERLKGELDASRKTVTEQNERSSLFRKQVETSESRIQELKKAIIADQREIKELRAKARNADQAKSHASSRQAELDQMKKILQNSEAKHKAELNDRDTKFAQQEKALVAERKRREASESQVNAAQTQAKEAKDRCQQLEGELEKARRSTDEANSAAVDEAAQLGNVRTTLTRAAEAYGELATSSVPCVAHRQLQLQHASLQLRSIRLERRLADREALAEQLTDYCRQASEEKAMLASALQIMEQDLEALLKRQTSFNEDTCFEDTSLIHSALHASYEACQLREAVAQTDLQTTQAFLSLYRTECEDLLVAYAAAHHQTVKQGVVSTRLVDACSEHQGEVDALRSEYRTVEATSSRQAVEIVDSVARARASEEQLTVQKRERARVEEALRKEREVNARLLHTTHQSKKTEDALRFEIDGLVDELQDVTRYKEAHADLLNEVVELIQRNELAEAEAERLGKFNAEILGHTNPQQKIFYMDRIRRELAETKHQLMKSTRYREDLMADNAALQHEVAAYKSIAVPVEYKPRSDRVRVERAPLLARSINGVAQNIAFELSPPEEEQIDTLPMTLEEIM